MTVRVARSQDALLVRARIPTSSQWLMARMVPFGGCGGVLAGPFCASPQRGGLVVRFTDWAFGPTETSLHLD